MTAPSMPNHQEYDELVAGHVLHALDEPDERRLADHLPQCAACRELLADLEGTAAELALPLRHPTPAGLDAAIRDGIRRADPAQPARRSGPGRFGRWAPLAAAASVLVLATAVVTLRAAPDGDGPRTGLAGAEAALRCQREPGCEPILLASADGATRAVALLRPTQASLLVEGFDPNRRADEIYVLWQQEPTGDMRAIATFDVGAGEGEVGPFDLAPRVRGDALLAISREPGRTAPPRPSRALLTSAA